MKINSINLMFIILLSSITFSQELGDSLIKDDYLPFKKNHWTFSITPHIPQKSEVTRISGDAYIVPSSIMSANFGITHTFNVKERHGIVIGLKTGSVRNGFAFRTDEEITEPHPLYAQYRSERRRNLHTTVRYYSFPVHYEHRIVYNEKLFINGFVGVNIRHNMARSIKQRRSYSNLVYDVSGDYFRQEYNFKSQDYLNYNFGFGALYKLKNNNLIRVNLNANISTNKENFGEYQFYDLVEDAHGINTIRMGYVGMEIGYTFTRTKRIKN